MMRPPDGPPAGPSESDWAQLLQRELDSWYPRRLSTRFERRPQTSNVWLPLQVAAAAAVVLLVAAAALAGGPRSLTLVIVNLASGHGISNPSPQIRSSSPTQAPVGLPPSPATAGQTATPPPSPGGPVSQPGPPSGVNGAAGTVGQGGTRTPTPSTSAETPGAAPKLPALPPLPSLPSLPTLPHFPALPTATPTPKH